jgi:hypothetical protein
VTAFTVMLALELLGDYEQRMADSFSLVPEGIFFNTIPEELCPSMLVSNTLNIDATDKVERPAHVALSEKGVHWYISMNRDKAAGQILMLVVCR